MLRRRQRGRRALKQTIAYNQVFGHARREGSARSDRDRIENGVAKTGRYLKTQMRCRSSGILEEAPHCSSALGAFEPAGGARQRSCGDSLSSDSFTWSFSVGGGKRVYGTGGFGAWYWPHATSSHELTSSSSSSSRPS